MKRIAPLPGEWIDRGRPIDFAFEGRRYAGFEGDSLCSALLANGVRVLGRSFKYHRPRGVLSAANHDVNAMFQLSEAGRSIPNVRADVEPLRAGLELSAVNTVGGLARDRLAILDRFSRFLPVGFYYKAFLSKRAFPRWERRIRNAAGLGCVDQRAERRPSAKRYAHTDVLVVGAGPSGLAAALSAAEAGAHVILAEESAQTGGSAGYARGGDALEARAQQLIAAVQAHPRIRVLTRTFASGYYADHWVALVAPTYLIKVRARAVVIAQGAFEQPAVFRGNDLPGVMLASGAQRLIYRYAVAPAARVALLVANQEGYRAALDAIACGIEVAAVLDLRSAEHASETALSESLRARGIPLHFDVRPVEATAGREGWLHAVEFEAGDTSTARRERIAVDGLWMSVGFAPANALLHQAGARMRFDSAVGQFLPANLPTGVFACGKVAGIFSLEDRIRNGAETGTLAAGHVGFTNDVPSSFAPKAPEPERGTPSHPYPIFPHPKGKEFVDFDEDLQLKDLVNAFQEGFDSSELLKRYSTVGMGPSQGKHSNMNALRILAKLRGESLEAVGTTTARPMFHPVPLSHLSGRAFYPQRRTPLHALHESLGAVWMPAGDWLRPEYYARGGESRETAIREEVLAVRNGVGLIDVGTLGKIEAHGAAAPLFLDRVYAGQFSTLQTGMTRYGLLLDEAGVIIDDGVIARLGPEHFYFTTTTSNSASVFRELGRLATLWKLPVGLVNLTGHFCAFNVAGPSARAVLRKLTSLDLSHAAFPYLGVRETHVAGVRCRLMRVGFVGEIGYEVHLPSGDAPAVWNALLSAGKSFGIRPFGVEAQRMLRLEKGHVIIGQDTDGLTHPFEIGAGWALRMNKPFFVGQRSLRILERKPARQQLVGFRLPDQNTARVRESHLIIDGSRIAGRVTSVGHSPTLGFSIGLALVDPQIARRGELRIRATGGAEVRAKVVGLPFYDERGERQRMEEAA
jgi:sarcosine oxidase subunit alpha